MGLRIAQDGGSVERCPRCLGRGRERCGEQYTVRTRNALGPFRTPGNGAWKPCSLCNGRKVFVGGLEAVK